MKKNSTQLNGKQHNQQWKGSPLKPESAFVLQQLLENFLNKICKQYNLSSDPESHHQLLKSYIREAFPGREEKFYLEIYSDLWRNIFESSKIFNQRYQGSESHDELDVNEEIWSKSKDEAPEAAETTGHVEIQKGEIYSLQIVKLALNQIAALGDYLVAIGDAKEIELHKEKLASIGELIHKITNIIEDLFNKHGFKEILIK